MKNIYINYLSLYHFFLNNYKKYIHKILKINRYQPIFFKMMTIKCKV